MKLLIMFLIFFSQSVFAAKECFIATDLNGKIIEEIGDCNIRVSPASSFKIPLAVMGYDSGIFVDATHPAWPYEQHYIAVLPTHKQTLNPTTWMKYSAIWYSQELTKKMGMEKFKAYVTAFDYGNKDVSGDAGQDNGLIDSWINSSLKISPKEQLTFLRKLIQYQLPASKNAQSLTHEILFNEEIANGWKLYGKTGSADNAGWYVGWVNKGDQTLVFAYLLQDSIPIKNPTEYAGPRAREACKKRIIALLEAGLYQ